MIVPIYASGELSAELRQGEIVTDVGKYVVNPSTKDVSVERYDYAIIATQDCDLLQDYNLRSEQKDSPLSGVLLFPMDTAISVRERFKGSEAKTRVFQNKDERYIYSKESALNMISRVLGYHLYSWILNASLRLRQRRYFIKLKVGLQQEGADLKCLTGNTSRRGPHSISRE
jgi:hypothetical protein